MTVRPSLISTFIDGVHVEESRIVADRTTFGFSVIIIRDFNKPSENTHLTTHLTLNSLNLLSTVIFYAYVRKLELLCVLLLLMTSSEKQAFFLNVFLTVEAK